MSWFSLTLILSFVASSLILSFRILTQNMNPFLLMFGVSTLAAIALIIYCTLTQTPLSISKTTFYLALLAGLSVCVLDICFIFMFRFGAPVSLAIPIYRVISIMISAVIGVTFFADSLTPVKMIGILTACLAVYLLNYKPKEEVHV